MHIDVFSLQIVEDAPVYVLIIHLAGAGLSQNLQKSSHGWVVSRTLPEIHKMHSQLIQVLKQIITETSIVLISQQ